MAFFAGKNRIDQQGDLFLQCTIREEVKVSGRESPLADQARIAVA